jgi:hypothetical protein
MTITNAVKKVEKVFGQKININENGQYSSNGLSFYGQDGKVNYVTVSGVNFDNLSQALKMFSL